MRRSTAAGLNDPAREPLGKSSAGTVHGHTAHNLAPIDGRGGGLPTGAAAPAGERRPWTPVRPTDAALTEKVTQLLDQRDATTRHRLSRIQYPRVGAEVSRWRAYLRSIPLNSRCSSIGNRRNTVPTHLRSFSDRRITERSGRNHSTGLIQTRRDLRGPSSFPSPPPHSSPENGNGAASDQPGNRLHLL